MKIYIGIILAKLGVGGGSAPSGNFLLLESGDYILLETGDKIILEN